ncbi:MULTISPECIES: lipocalin family protein [Pseudomonas]|uniref:Apolipoprotein D and lipocalin family protein n=1 Tax=Pseudomonas hunanensis TaxID=1247546 RepID=A0ACC6K2G3_9PSED|nr:MULTISPECIES: lipocalin family protein [Pseudomonas]MBP2260038.1 apolipoprotein D and lipocalin family protein [Pseudomonas sp. BP8]MDR6712617.1 apolipoprotein D and lipocalin family protein [Pseudomonas hunanensis]HDS1738150.1 lipocalin family protein [Pseudomonas putida]
MRHLSLLVGLCLALVLSGCATSGSDALAPNTAGPVNLKRYQGKWYELARLPMYFQRDCAQSEAHYNAKPDGTLGVLNRCRMLDGEWIRAEGSARPQEVGHTDKLWVEFDNWFTRLAPGVAKGEYWVLYVDSRYRTALVGSPDRKYLWILSRTPSLPAWERENLLAKARQQGYDTNRLIWRVSDRDIAARH